MPHRIAGGLVCPTESSEAGLEVVKLVRSYTSAEVSSVHSQSPEVVMPRIDYRRGVLPELAEPAALEANVIETKGVNTVAV